MWVIFRQNYIGFYKNFLLYTDQCKCSYLQGCKTKILYFIICSLLIVSLNPCASLISITLSFFSLHLSLSLSLSLQLPLTLLYLSFISTSFLLHFLLTHLRVPFFSDCGFHSGWFCVFGFGELWVFSVIMVLVCGQ